MWETKQYARLNAEQIEFLNEAKKRFNDALTDIRFDQWLNGQITAGAVSEEFGGWRRGGKCRFVLNSWTAKPPCLKQEFQAKIASPATKW
jgi:hypothetical protein